MARTELPAELLNGVHVLIVEDHADSRAFLEVLLRYCGGLVTSVASARDALQTLQRVIPDVIVSDISMPIHDGYWLIRRIRALPADRGGTVPAIAITAHGYPHEVSRTIDAGFHAHLRKPVDPWELARTIAALSARRS